MQAPTGGRIGGRGAAPSRDFWDLLHPLQDPGVQHSCGDCSHMALIKITVIIRKQQVLILWSRLSCGSLYKFPHKGSSNLGQLPVLLPQEGTRFLAAQGEHFVQSSKVVDPQPKEAHPTWLLVPGTSKSSCDSFENSFERPLPSTTGEFWISPAGQLLVQGLQGSLGCAHGCSFELCGRQKLNVGI